MLRNARKRIAADADSARKHKKSTIKQIGGVLGSKASKDDEEEELESLVIGSDKDLLQNLDGRKQDDESDEETDELKSVKKETCQPAPAWVDEDDNVDEKIKVSKKDLRHAYFKHEKTNEVSAAKYKATLKTQFTKISGTPKWAKMKWEKGESDHDDSDTEGQELLQKTGDYTTASVSLPRGSIDLKQCTNANREEPLTGKCKNVEFHPTAQVMLAAGMSQTLTLFQVDGDKNARIQSVFLDKFPILTAHFSRDGREVICGSRHKSFYYYDMIAGKVTSVPQLKGCEDSSTGRFVMSPDGGYILFLGKYGRMNLVTTSSKEWVATLKMNGSVEAAAFSPDGSRLYSHGDDGEVYVWDMRTRDCIHRFVDDGCIKGTALGVSPSGQYVATGCHSGVVNIYDDTCLSQRRPAPLKAVMNLTSPCTSMTFNPTTEILAISSDFAENAVKFVIRTVAQRSLLYERVHFPSLTVFSNFPDKGDHLRIPYCTDFSPHGGYFTMGNNKGEALLYRVKHYGSY